MARGGLRPKAGRPKGAKDKVSKALDVALHDLRAILGDGLTPLAYLLSVMRDETMSVELRLEAAGKALPYCHKRQPTDISVEAVFKTPPPVLFVFGPLPNMPDDFDPHAQPKSDATPKPDPGSKRR